MGELTIVLKDYRNLIHPGVEVRVNESFDLDTAELAISILDLLIKKVELKYKEKFGTTADNLLFKLDEDWNYHSVYGLVITKLSPIEKTKLMSELVDIDEELKSQFNNFDGKIEGEELTYPNIATVKSLANELKPLLNQSEIQSYVYKILTSITDDDNIETLVLYNLFHEDIHSLIMDEQELISIYMLSLFTDIVENCKELCHEKTYSTIGKYIHSEKGILASKEMIEFSAVNFHLPGIVLEYEMDTFEQFINSFSEENRNLLITHLEEFLGGGKRALPDHVFAFAKEAKKRTIISFEPQSEGQ